MVLSRKQNESVQIDSEIRVTVVSIRKGLVKLGISAPDHVRIIRQELIERAAGGSKPVDRRQPDAEADTGDASADAWRRRPSGLVIPD